MQQNMGSADSFVRVLVGISFLVNIIIIEPGPVGTVILLALGILFLATAWVKYCPAYKPLSVCTCCCGTHEAKSE